MIICGADPGTKGALVALDSESSYCNHYKLKFDKAKDLELDSLLYWLLLVKPELILLEKVQGRGGWGAGQTFTFGSSFGQLLTVLRSSGCPLKRIPPQSWQKEFHMHTFKGASPKQSTKLAISQRFPFCPKLHEGVADAFLIAAYGVMKYDPQGNYSWDFKNLV